MDNNEQKKTRLELTRVLAHELNTPLTAITVASGLLTSELTEEPGARLASNIYRSAVLLRKCIDELSDLAKSDLGMIKLNITPVSMVTLIRDIISEVELLTTKQNQSLIVELPTSLPVVYCDKERIKQVIKILLENACKLAGEEGEVTLLSKEEKGNLVVEVKDSGISLTEEQQDRLFHPYQNMDEGCSFIDRLSLSIGLCKHLVELHGGRIWVESESSKGNTFSFLISIGRSAGEPGDNNRCTS